MTFHSLDYLLFFAVLLPCYWALPRRAQNALLLVASWFFYGYVHPWFLSLLLTSIVLDYLCALGMARFPAQRRPLLGFSLLGNLGLLGFFKYFDFFAENVARALAALGLPAHPLTLKIFLPVGISFYTFQSLSYTIDVYRGVLSPRRSFVDFALFVSLFPQLVAGPIERAVHLLPQVERRRSLDLGHVHSALWLLLFGFFQKLVVADRVALIADRIFALEEPGFALLWVGVLAFCVQIYADFQGYIHIARGSARLLGFELSRNFDHPYLSQGPAEFWRRWNISLSSWFRDYVYIPLGGNRGTAAQKALHVMATFTLSGLWHGASLNFVLWGAYHGVLLLAYRGVARVAPELLALRQLALPRWLVFFLFTNVGWLLFRERDLEALGRALLLPLETSSGELAAAGYLLGEVLLLAAPLVAYTAVDHLRVTERLGDGSARGLAEGAASLVLALGLLTLASPGATSFIYFQF